eukprot:1161226-Pelagomonas_calceolata.AAC.6
MLVFAPACNALPPHVVPTNHAASPSSASSPGAGAMDPGKLLQLAGFPLEAFIEPKRAFQTPSIGLQNF